MMNFAKELKEAMSKKNISLTELSSLSGVGKSNISQYLSGKNTPKETVKQKLSEALDYSFDEIGIQTLNYPFVFSTTTITTRQAARIMHMSEKNLCEQLQKGSIPIGNAYLSEGSSKWTYYISPKLFYEFTGWRE